MRVMPPVVHGDGETNPWLPGIYLQNNHKDIPEPPPSIARYSRTFHVLIQHGQCLQNKQQDGEN